MDYFIEKCREVYFCTEEYSDAAFIVSNFCLYGIFYELHMMEKDDSIGQECQDYIEMCRDNLEAALANLNILMPATQESINALAVGVSSLSFMISSLHLQKFRPCMQSKSPSHPWAGTLRQRPCICVRRWDTIV